MNNIEVFTEFHQPNPPCDVWMEELPIFVVVPPELKSAHAPLYPQCWFEHFPEYTGIAEAYNQNIWPECFVETHQEAFDRGMETDSERFLIVSHPSIKPTPNLFERNESSFYFSAIISFTVNSHRNTNTLYWDDHDGDGTFRQDRILLVNCALVESPEIQQNGMAVHGFDGRSAAGYFHDHFDIHVMKYGIFASEEDNIVSILDYAPLAKIHDMKALVGNKSASVLLGLDAPHESDQTYGTINTYINNVISSYPPSTTEHLHATMFISSIYSMDMTELNDDLSPLAFTKGWYSSWLKFNTDGSLESPIWLNPPAAETLSIQISNTDWMTHAFISTSGTPPIDFGRLQRHQYCNIQYLKLRSIPAIVVDSHSESSEHERGIFFKAWRDWFTKSNMPDYVRLVPYGEEPEGMCVTRVFGIVPNMDSSAIDFLKAWHDGFITQWALRYENVFSKQVIVETPEADLTYKDMIVVMRTTVENNVSKGMKYHGDQLYNANQSDEILKFFDVFFKLKRFYDICVLTFDEPEEKIEALITSLQQHVPNRIYRVHKVNGIKDAHCVAAKYTQTRNFYVVDGDATVLDFQIFTDSYSPVFRRNTTIWYARNDLNGGEYGYGGIKLFDKTAFAGFKESFGHTDITMAIAAITGLLVIPKVASITRVADSPFSVYKSVYREVTKLTKQLHSLAEGEGNESKIEKVLERLAIWADVLPEHEHYHTLVGQANQAVERLFVEQQSDVNEINALINSREHIVELYTQLTGSNQT